MQQLRIFLDIHELWRQIDPDGPIAQRRARYKSRRITGVIKLFAMPDYRNQDLNPTEASCRVLEEYRALPRDMPRDQMTEQQKSLGIQAKIENFRITFFGHNTSDTRRYFLKLELYHIYLQKRGQWLTGKLSSYFSTEIHL